MSLLSNSIAVSWPVIHNATRCLLSCLQIQNSILEIHQGLWSVVENMGFKLRNRGLNRVPDHG